MPESVETVKLASLTPELFWKAYVSKRQPVLIEGHPIDPSWKATKKWTLPYLRENAGDSAVLVEKRDSVKESFGKGTTTKMPFDEFLDALESDNQHLYLSAQNAEVAPDGFPELLSPPLTELSTDIVTRPALLGHLIPQQINLWMGCAQRGSSSGLHHDYHDNLYILLKGSKHFSLFPPSLADQMYTHGHLEHIHPNGRIVYKGQGDVLPDGSDAREVALWKKRCERLHQDGQETDSTDESELEAILDHCDEEHDDYDDCTDVSAESGDETDSSQDRQSTEIQQDIKRRRISTPDAKEGKEQPLSFSRVDLQLSEKEQRDKFPDFPGLSVALQCEVSESQMLYLPAGWFHDVTSTGSDPAHLHMALNYWCYPPDNIEDTEEAAENGFTQPYLSDYWPDMWARRHSAARHC